MIRVFISERTVSRTNMENKSPAFTPEGTLGPYYPGVFLTQIPQDLSTVSPLLTHKRKDNRFALQHALSTQRRFPFRVCWLNPGRQMLMAATVTHWIDRSVRTVCSIHNSMDLHACARMTTAPWNLYDQTWSTSGKRRKPGCPGAPFALDDFCVGNRFD